MYCEFGIDEAFCPKPYPKEKPIEFDSFIVGLEELKEGDFRLLEVNRRAVVPTGKTLARITRDDVMHR